MQSQYCVSLASIQKAHRVIHDLVHQTPVLTNSTLDKQAERKIFLKCELFQKTGSFKSRMETVSKVIAETQGIQIHSNQDALVIAGQGTIGLEILQQVPDVQAVVVPVGGGGMVSGITVAIKTQRPQVKIYAAEPEKADDCYQSKQCGCLTPNKYAPVTIADGVKTSIGEKTWPIIRDLVDDVFTVSEEEIKRATRLMWERAKLVIEPTAGVGVAVVLSPRFRDLPGNLRNVCVVLCGGNVDLDSLDWLKVTE
ncbi:serine racemase-like isoform X2 [Chiloscyllium plagiosum]|uniref:serine racemase-like isoform X2 n=1 Tax=Chiloscyllium plagiosum TaxID=36176 RepID=UPI001CB7CD7A|nr:serine racemase-like isoform X2 [Chiloscyllium plagiosum]